MPKLNDSRLPDPRRERANELARLLASERGDRAIRLLQTLGTRPERPPTAMEPSLDPAAGPRPISIWKPIESEGGFLFRRPEPGPYGDHHADRLEISAAKPTGTRRLILFGESVAAGYLHAPHLTPAKLLQRQLDCLGKGALEGPAWEVVDLARSNETLGPMARTVEASIQLAPDLLVIFAGNNWNLLETPELSPHAPSVAGRQRYARAMARYGSAGPEQLAHRALDRKARRAFGHIARTAEASGAAVLLLLPEVNLADWESRQPPAWLPGDGNRRWYALSTEARQSLARGESAAAETAARAMLQLDGGLCPTSHRLLAKSLSAQGRNEEALEAARQEVDQDPYTRLCFLGAPRANTWAREALAEAAEAHGFVTLDLRSLFAAQAPEPGAFPGRRLFLDYCHLSLEGMHLAMAAVAAQVMDRPVEETLAELPAPGKMADLPTAARATARLGAAVHGAHRLLAEKPEEILEYWCRRAVDAAPEALSLLVDLALARAAPLPAVLTPAQNRVLASPYPLSLQHGWRWEGLDPDLLRVALELLSTRDPEGKGNIEQALLRFHGVHAREDGSQIDLSRQPYLWRPLERFFPEVMSFADRTSRATLRCPWQETSFCLVAEAGQDLLLEPRLRLPPFASTLRPRAGEVEFLLDGHSFARLPLNETWCKKEIPLPGHLLHRVLHQLTLRWPELPRVDADPLAPVIRRLKEGQEAELHPIFGEVYSLLASVAEIKSGS